MPAHLSNYLIMLPLLGWIVWRRVSSSFGLQPIRRKRMLVRIGIFVVLGGLLALTGLQQPELAEGLIGGALLGSALGMLGLRLTRFATDPVRGDCYVPNPWIGALLTVLLLGRLAWRLLVMLPQAQQAAAPDTGFSMPSAGYAASPLTMLLIGLLIGYYIVYFSGLLIHHRRYQRAQAAPPQAI